MDLLEDKKKINVIFLIFRFMECISYIWKIIEKIIKIVEKHMYIFVLY